MAALKRNILFVDDDPMARKLVESMLTQAGYVVTTAEDGFDALELLYKYAFDLVILDIMMSKMNGLELLKRIKSQPETQSLPIMMLSSRDDQKIITKALQMGAADYMIRPPDRDVMLRKLETILGGRPRFAEVYIDQGSPLSECSMIMEGRILSMGESGMTFSSPLPLAVGANQKLDSPLFEQMKLNPPPFRVVHCQPEKSGYVIYVNFHNLKLEDVKRIREWVISRAFKGRTVA